VHRGTAGSTTASQGSPAARGIAAWLLTSALAAVLLAGCSDAAEDPSPAPPTPDVGTPLGDLDTRRTTVARAPFCDALDEAAVTRALDGEVRKETSYAPGDRVRLSADLRDVAHEFGCVFKGAAKAEARAWVFTPPVTRKQAKELAADAPGRRCAVVEDAPTFGKPSVAVRCREDGKASGARSVATVRFSGLFGDAWLSCSVRARGVGRGALLDRADRWCAAVVSAVEAEPAADPTG
jgi:hypothetical protein